MRSPDSTRLERWPSLSALDGPVCLYQLNGRREQRRLVGHTFGALSVAFHSQLPRLATYSDDHSVILLDAETAHPLHRWTAHANYVTGLAFSPDGSMIASSCGRDHRTGLDFSIRRWDAGNGTPRYRLPGNTTGVRALAFDPTSRRLASGDDDGNAHDQSIQSLALSPEGLLLATGGTDRLVVLRDPETFEALLTFPAWTGAVDDLGFDASGRWLALVGSDAEVGIWDLKMLHDELAAVGLAWDQPAPAVVSTEDLGPFIKRIATLPAGEQVEQVGKELKKRNPDYDGMLTSTIEKDAVIGLTFTTDHSTDISPVRALTRLRKLVFLGSDGRTGSLADLSPLKGMPLTFLDLSENGGIKDLTPLKGIPLKTLDLGGTAVTDLTPLMVMPLERLYMWGGFRGSDLTPVKGMPLDELNIKGTFVIDLSVLQDLPLKILNCDVQLPRRRQGSQSDQDAGNDQWRGTDGILGPEREK